MKDRDVHLLNINLLHSLYVASLPLKCQNGVFIFTYISVVQETVASTYRFPHHLDYFRSINNLFSLVRLHKQKTVGHYQACKTQDFWQIWIRNCRYFSYVIWYSLTLQVFHPDTCFFLNNLTDQGKVLNNRLELIQWIVLRIIKRGIIGRKSQNVRIVISLPLLLLATVKQILHFIQSSRLCPQNKGVSKRNNNMASLKQACDTRSSKLGTRSSKRSRLHNWRNSLQHLGKQRTRISRHIKGRSKFIFLRRGFAARL